MTDVTEFTFLDPEEMHLVPVAANGFDALLAKARDALEETMTDTLVKGCGVDGCYVCADAAEKKRLKAADRSGLPDSDFALPEKREYPINDVNHAHAALSMLHNASPDEQERIKAAVHEKFPDIEISKQTAPDKGVPEGEAESQTREVDAGPEGAVPSPGNDDHGEAKHMSFPHGAAGDGAGDTAPDKTVPTGEAMAQTRGNAEGAAKAEGDGTGDTAPDKDLHEGEAESQTGDDVEGDAEKGVTHVVEHGAGKKKMKVTSWHDSGDPDSTPGSPAWENKDVALGERAEALAGQLTEVIRAFTEREKAEGGASKQTWGVIRRIRSLLANPEQLRKVAETMSDTTELLKALDELESAHRADKKARKAAKAAEETEAAKAADEAAKAASVDTEVGKAVDEQIDKLQKQIDELSAKRPFVNGIGATAMLRGPEAQTALKSFDDRVVSAEEQMAKASSEYEVQMARTELEMARKARFMAKMVARDTAQANRQIPPGRFGPNSTDLFGGSSLTLPEDRAVKAI